MGLVKNTNLTRSRASFNETPSAIATLEKPCFLLQKESPPSDFKGFVTTYWERVPAIPIFINLFETSTEPLSGSVYANLWVGDGFFHVPLSNDLIFAQFSCTDGSVAWDESDLVTLEGKTAAEILAAGLNGKIVLIGDSNQEFEMYGQRKKGPLVFRTDKGAIQLVRYYEDPDVPGDLPRVIYQVTPMMLQPLPQTTVSPASKNRIVYTVGAAITPQDGDLVLVDGIGDIYLPDKPTDGFRFTLDDRKSRWLTIGRNSIIPATGATIGAGQTTATIDNRTPLTWSEVDRGSFSSYIYEAASNNWVALLTREVSGPGIVQSTVKPPIMTTNAPTIAVPYQSYYLGGNGDILIYTLSHERDFIDISWDAGATYIVNVVCPVGYTILGVFEDLLINTARTSATHHKLFLKAGNDFGVSA